MTKEETSICLHGHPQTCSALPDLRFLLQQNEGAILTALVAFTEYIYTKQQGTLSVRVCEKNEVNRN